MFEYTENIPNIASGGPLCTFQGTLQCTICSLLGISFLSQVYLINKKRARISVLGLVTLSATILCHDCLTFFFIHNVLRR